MSCSFHHSSLQPTVLRLYPPADFRHALLMKELDLLLWRDAILVHTKCKGFYAKGGGGGAGKPSPQKFDVIVTSTATIKIYNKITKYRFSILQLNLTFLYLKYVQHFMKTCMTLVSGSMCACAHCTHRHFPLPGKNPVWNFECTTHCPRPNLFSLVVHVRTDLEKNITHYDVIPTSYWHLGCNQQNKL